MVVEGDYEEIGEHESELNLTDDDALPWLEADEEEHRGGGIDIAQWVGFFTLLAVGLLAVWGMVWWVSNRDKDAEVMADGSTIEAPDGPYKERPDDAGGREFPGTGDVAPGVGEGEAPEATMANDTGAGSGDQDLNIAMPAIGGATPAVSSGTGAGTGAVGASGSTSSNSTNAGAGSAKTAGPNAASSGAGSTTAGSNAATGANASGVGVQLAAYSSRARAEQGWRQFQRQTTALKGMRYRVVEGQIDIGTVYRLQALPGGVSQANALCRTLKSQGLDCQVKQ